MTVQHTTHTVDIAAPARRIYEVIADVTTWPGHFPPTVLAERVAFDGTEERIRIWAIANDRLKSWESIRRLNEDAGTIEFEQARPSHPVAAMGGTWRINERPGGGCRVVLTHHYAAAGDDPEALALIDRAVDNNSKSELAALGRAAERAADQDELSLDFEDSEVIKGSVDAVYDFIYACREWPRRLPHVQRIELTEDEPGLQFMEMDTRSPDGPVHTTASGRVCLPGDRIVYKQTRLPAVMSTHNGEWVFRETGAGAVHVTSRHTVVIDPKAAAQMAKDGTPVPALRKTIRETLGANSMATLRSTKAYVEGQTKER